ncbi:MAG: type II toxin-antitoxin system RelE/ParE family toxin [Gammaproteobacteria bacterium]|nr:type II toxin-antitoxin system RelE/ParE family toxin [Gammaproteobacteria bacterium]MBU1655845.1 type II toxin-antitoxin system RelE/ParE family toxin [Gammaproteobacteria bacterium]MBU1960080.1 type II toxin-antitoxin system RelE/ParE family toxin [Gammaproteobacteria bacterium]
MIPAIQLRKFLTATGHCPLDTWLHGLKDKRAAKRVQIRIDRLALGLEGDWRSVGSDVRELRIPEGKGYRVYYAWDSNQIVLLLCGGDKTSQSKDIEQAHDYWRQYREQQPIGSL